VRKKISKTKYRYDWKPDLPDFRDHILSLAKPTTLPAKIDLSPQCSPIVNQGRIGSCTGNALAGAFEFLELKELASKSNSNPQVFDDKSFSPVSRLFIYYNERIIEKTVDQDAGARLRDGVKVLNKLGACREAIWKYQSTLLYKKPTKSAYDEAAKHKVTEYLKITTMSQLKQCLADGYPVVFGFTVYESFESSEVAQTGIMPLPEPDEHLLGGHAVLAVGYDDHTKTLLVRNSWGTDWGQKGYFHMPYAYIESLHLAQDFWMIRK
jgi:C1A family cysteine protease